MRQFEDGHYWVQVSNDSEPEVALHDHGRWRLYGKDKTIETEDFFRIGRRAKVPADAFEAEIEEDGDIGV